MLTSESFKAQGAAGAGEQQLYVTPSVTALLLRMCDREIAVNFPQELNSAIDEVKILDRLGFDVGETALNVAL